jgi:membrane fusion protein, adhesin transport system
MTRAPLSATNVIEMESVRLVQPPVNARRLSKFLLSLLLASSAAMLFLPWQQTSKGTGRVIAYDPTERPQTVEAPIYGRVVGWAENLVEGMRVKKGQPILEIADNDPQRAQRLQEQVDAAAEKLKFATEKAQSYFSQIEEYRESRTVIIESYTKLVEVAAQKLEAAKRDLDAAMAAEVQLELDFQRQDTLAKEGIVAAVRGQEAKAKWEQAVAKRKAAENYIAAAEGDRAAKQAELGAKTREANAKVQEAEAKHQQAQGEESLARKELAEIEGKAAEFGQRSVEAPRDGILFRLHVADKTQMLKQGDPLFTIVPETAETAVELWVNGNDVPLIHPGRIVRLQFEGWPAVQFGGWPSVAVGTFPGEIVAIDATDDGNGRFRVLARPQKREDWPSEKFLRQGARANGWIMLNEVSLGYEVWRQLNGFPPAMSAEPKDESEGEKVPKKVKLPK